MRAARTDEANGRRSEQAHRVVPRLSDRLEPRGIATGILTTAIHRAGLVSLTCTPSPMAFPNDILSRPSSEGLFLVLVVGYAAADAQVPAITRKPLKEIATFLQPPVCPRGVAGSPSARVGRVAPGTSLRWRGETHDRS